MADRKSAAAHQRLAIDMYEKKIADKTITASEMSQYRGLLKDLGWDRELAEPGEFQPPSVDGQDDEPDDIIIKFR